MKRVVFALALIYTVAPFASESAGITGMVVTNNTIRNNNFTYPQDIHTVYFPNDPSEGALTLVYLAYKKTGIHQPSVEITNKDGKHVDRCRFESIDITEIPWTQTITCRWGGRQSDGGLNFTIYDKFGGKQEKLGELFLAAENP